MAGGSRVDAMSDSALKTAAAGDLPSAMARLFDELAEAARGQMPQQTESLPDIPVTNYLDPERWEAERDVLFRRYPLIAAHGSRLAPGHALALNLAGLPVVLTRNQVGEVAAFLNVCRHRGMRLLEEGEGRRCNALVCPYHGWSYELDGALKNISRPEFFPDVGEKERASLALRALPCEERHGLIWVLPDPEGSMDLDSWLGALGEDFDYLGLARDRCWHHSERQREANWKLIIDAFLESYHVRVLHRNTVYPFFLDSVALSHDIGPHTRSAVARRGITELTRRPASEGALREVCTYTHFVFPNAVFIFHPDYTSLITIWPDEVGRLGWKHSMLVPPDRMDDSWRAHWDKSLALIDDGVFQAEDLYAAEGIQVGLASGANESLRLGAMEYLVARFHQHVEQALQGRL